MSRLTRDGTAEPVSRDQILRRERRQGNIDFPRSADHEQDWQPYPVDPCSCYYMCDHTYIHTYGQIALLYFSVPAQCEPFGLTSASAPMHNNTNTDLPTPDAEGHKGGNTSACYHELLQVTRVRVVKTLGC